MTVMDVGVLPGSQIGAERWHELITSVFGNLDMQLGDASSFSGSIRHASLEGIELADVSSSYEDSTRTRRHVAQDSRESFVVVMPLQGRLQIHQDHRECDLGPGQFALFNLNAPHRYYHPGPVRALSLKAPCDLLRARAGKLDDRVATAFAADQGIARITFDFLASVLRERSCLPDHVAAGYGSRIADMTAMMLGSAADVGAAGRSTVQQVIHHRCLQLIDLHLGDPNLNAGRIASQCGISIRYLHKVFQDSGQTLGETLRNRRLAVCHDRLMTQRGALQIKDVALSAGFRSASHFCNAFKSRYGVSPRELRR